MENFLPELLAKLKAAGLPVLENDAELLYKLVSDHVKGFKYPQPLVQAIVPVAMASLDGLVLAQIDKIDPNS